DPALLQRSEDAVHRLAVRAESIARGGCFAHDAEGHQRKVGIAGDSPLPGYGEKPLARDAFGLRSSDADDKRTRERRSDQHCTKCVSHHRSPITCLPAALTARLRLFKEILRAERDNSRSFDGTENAILGGPPKGITPPAAARKPIRTRCSPMRLRDHAAQA